MINRYDVKEISEIWSDQNKFKTYLKYELALINALEAEGTAPKLTATRISDTVSINTKRIHEIEKEVKHDVIAFCSSITEQLSEKDARFFHYGVTSSDVIDSSINLMIKESLEIIESDFKLCLESLYKFAHQAKDIVCIGRSHGINAEPMSLGVKFLSHYTELYRRYIEIKKYISEEITLQCSGAVGNYTILDSKIEKHIAKNLNLKVEEVSSQVIPRDRIIKLMGIVSSFGAGLDRLCTELRHLQHSNISEVSEGFSEQQKGSSTMPHKKNPISAENLSGVSRLLKSYYQVALENNNLWHERDISHSSAERFILPDSMGLFSYSLRRLNSLIKGLVIHHQKISSNIPKNKAFLSSFCLHYLLKRTKTRREDLYKIIQKSAFQSTDQEDSFINELEIELRKANIDIQIITYISEIKEKDLYLKEVEKIFERTNKIYNSLA